MTALTAGRRTSWSEDSEFEYPVFGGAHIWAGAAIGLDSSGYLRPMAASTNLRFVGVATFEANNVSGSSGDITCKGRARPAWFHNSLTAPVLASDVHQLAYFEDDQTVARIDNGGVNSPGAMIMQVDANNGVLLNSSLDSAAGTKRMMVFLGTLSSKASDAATFLAPVPVNGRITKLTTVLNNALATADATVQLQYGATAGALANVGSTTTGRATITQASSAAGDVDYAVPLTTNIDVAATGVLKAIVGGGSTATGTVNVYAEITY